MSRRILLLTALVLAGCTSEPAPTPPPPPSGSTVKLVAFDSCEQLDADLKKAAKAAVGPWGLDVLRPRAAGGVVPGGARTMADSAPAAKPAPGPGHSGTNVHEAGVDEPDIVKTDGKRIVTLAHGSLQVVDATSHKVTGRLALEAWGNANLLLSGDRALVLTQGGDTTGIAFDGKMPAGPVPPEFVLVDLAGPPKIISRYRGEGRLIDARQTGDTARIVLSRPPRITFPDRPTARDEQDLIAANRRVIDHADVDAWLPSWTVTTGGITEKGKVNCQDVRRPPTFSGRSLLTVLTFPLSAPKLDGGRPVSIVADGDTVYGTPTSLYVATDQRWRLDFFPGRDNREVEQRTDIFRFDVAGAEPPVYRSAGRVPGFLLNQYAMSEWDGHLRIATTDAARNSSAVRVLSTDLKQVGEVTGLGKDEQIYSVRFIGDRGYVVTFRQTDPLYSLDLRDPAKPKVTGELKITGYSAHLQPVGPDRLIGVGQEASEEGRRQGTQVSLFDVSDPAAPRRLARHHVPDGWSEAEYDPHAILWWPDTKLFAVPLNAGTLALTVTDNGLTEAGRVARRSDGTAVRRNLVVGGELWSLSDQGLQVSRLSTLEPVTYVTL